MNDVRVVELAHDAGLRQEVPPLLVGIAGLQRLDGHTDLPLPRHLKTATTDLTKLPWKHTFRLKMWNNDTQAPWCYSTGTINPTEKGVGEGLCLCVCRLEGVHFKHWSGSLIPHCPSFPHPLEQRERGNGYWFLLFIILSLDDISLATGIARTTYLASPEFFFHSLTSLEADQMLLARKTMAFILKAFTWEHTQSHTNRNYKERYLHETNTKYVDIPIKWMILSKLCYCMP